MMITPDVLDRRALALVSLTDPFGRPLVSRVGVEGRGVRVVAKAGGLLAVLEAPGLAAHSAAFGAPPAAPALRTQVVALDLKPVDGGLMPRRFALRLPRDPDPSRRADPLSLFHPENVELGASPQVRMTGNACILRASVRRAADGACVEGALVRASAANGTFSAWALTDAAGEAALVFPGLPVSFAGQGGAVSDHVAARVIVHADPASARFAKDAHVADARRAAALRTSGFVDPDALAAAHAADFSAGTQVQLAAGTQPSIQLQWSAP